MNCSEGTTSTPSICSENSESSTSASIISSNDSTLNFDSTDPEQLPINAERMQIDEELELYRERLDSEVLDREVIVEDFSVDETLEYLEEIADFDEAFENSSDFECDDYDQNNCNGEESPFTYLENLIRKEEFNEPIDGNIILSKSELLLGILKFSEKYALPNCGVADLCKLFNTSIGSKALPDTRYKLDKMLYPTAGLEFHGVCPQCFMYISTYSPQDRSLQCKNCEHTVNVKDTSYNEFFVVSNFKLELEHCINENYDYYMTVMNDFEERNEFTDINDGQMYLHFRNNIPESHKNSYVSLTFNSDGSPVFKSSKFSVWPIHVVPNEVPANARNSKPIRHMLWFGHKKPDMSIMLQIFVDKINQLSNEDGGLNMNINNEIKNIKVYAICCCVDSVARAPMQGIIQFNGYYGCNWCLDSGSRVFHEKGFTIKYPLRQDVVPNRTIRNTIDFAEEGINTARIVFGVKSASPLLLLNQFDIIEGFVPDFMHVLPLGVVRQFAEYWFSSKRNPYSLSERQIKRVDTYLDSIKAPSHLSRFSRSINDRKYWKSREWENWLLYYSLPIISDFDEMEEYAQHWSLIVASVHLLLKDSISVQEIQQANMLIKLFVADTERLYGKDAMTYNIHQLLHVPQSVINWGPLWSHFGYPFENGNGQLLNVVHAAKGVVSQMCRHIIRQQSLIIFEKYVKTIQGSPILPFIEYLNSRITMKSFKINNNRYFGKKRKLEDQYVNQFNLDDEHYFTYQRLLKSNCMYATVQRSEGRSDNSYAMTCDKEYISIIHFIVNEETLEELILCKKIEIVENYSDMCNNIKIISINENIEVIPTYRIEKPCVHVKIKNNSYMSHIPNTTIYT
ncbi:hypothetical protein TKK_0015517 [Trichogramma kaykai]|uniref:Transposase domain-containing protein n=1 Tax=Trichogramma kaykai TaxID=54128 RepID=A0ABD2W9Z5_9HYME